jgi:hypothetical protein
VKRKKRVKQVEAEIRRWGERGEHTVWTDARWFEVIPRERVEEILMEYGYGPLRSERTARYGVSATVFNVKKVPEL